MLKKTLESPFCKEIQPVHPKRDQFWVFIGRTDVEAETPVIWPLDAKRLIGKDPDAMKDWGQEKGMTEDEMVGWQHWHNGHEFGRILGVGDGQGSLACCGSWGCKESDMTEWTELNWNQSPWLQTILRSYSLQNSMILAQKLKYRSMEQARKPRNKSMNLWSINLWQRRQDYTLEKR